MLVAHVTAIKNVDFQDVAFIFYGVCGYLRYPFDPFEFLADISIHLSFLQIYQLFAIVYIYINIIKTLLNYNKTLLKR